MINRVEIPVYCDLWMRGARFGEVIRTYTSRKRGNHLIAVVKMDHPQVKRPIKVQADDLRYID